MLQNKLTYGKTIGIIGGGQLGRMMTTQAKHMGYRVVVLDPTPDCPTAQVADDQIVAKYDDLDAIKELAEKSDVVTYEFENVDLKAAEFLEGKGILPQGARSLRITQDREVEKEAIVESGQPVAPYKIVTTAPMLKDAIAEIGYPLVVKTCRGGYDGKGQVKLENEDNLSEAEAMLEKNGRVIVEKWVSFDKEISIVFSRKANGDISYFPVAENIHRNHILYTTIVPARVSESTVEKAKEAAAAIASTINVVGTFAIEMFVQGENILINEMAPRPHNSGHYTIEACNVSQFEQHVRAICNLPLAPIYFHGAAVMLNLLGKDVDLFFNRLNEIGYGHVHMYGKEENKPERKMGHVTYIGDNFSNLYRDLIEKSILEDKN
ncbi:5-(carboxyamino)imidazole ribonucleotide synthase [Saliterribacillus persicus]|uniref:N5-carboxyaminoimidazole ribonucleotide synthase n=1 Tax=Saliterribacillus persicus TaxID=930114 RepID=A0A368XH58_9BACI|nr:5-(carboxyamino)imidazole ribonucleotide synthase [Saliterribacillus persicus]RCW65817.1 5-(carboxyamino)imidazole ribonucleotide synthase [Saliterribacillus persicus]